MNRKEYLANFFKDNKLNIFLALILYVVSSLTNIVSSWYLQVIVDTVTKSSNFTFWNLLLIALAILLALSLSTVIGVFAYPRFLSKAISQYKDYAFEKLLRKNIASFSRENTATYISALTNDVISIEDNYLKNIFLFVQYAIMFLGSFVLMIYYSLPLTFIVMTLASIPFLVSILSGRKLAQKEMAVSSANETYMATVKDILSGFTVVKSFKAEEEISTMFARANAHLQRKKEGRDRTSQFISGISNLAFILTQAGTMLIGAWMILNKKGGLTAGMLLGFMNLVMYVVQPISYVPGILAKRKASFALIDKMTENLSHHVEDRGMSIPQTLKKGIELKDLSFSYDGKKEALVQINGLFEPHKAYALVGASGSGKSTLLNLLMGSNSNYRGQILFDEVEQRDISSNSLYDILALIQQNVFIFNATISDNITMFKEFPAHEVQRVIQLSGLDQLILEKGQEYLCGENGNKLSGGERQRVAIARSLLRKSSVLLVDEATSALDNQTAHTVSQAILDLKEITRIVVTHRLEQDLLTQYDKLLVLKNGVLVEEGTFQELLDQKEYFYSLFMVNQ